MREAGQAVGRAGGQAERRTGRFARLLNALRRIAGMPDYAGYVAHMAGRHPGCPVLSEREFYDQYVNARYGNGASRCC
jgi:uncharacterized short protein YbdD (DUF466 family)